MITSEHHDSALSSQAILFVFLSIHVVFFFEWREKERRDIKAEYKRGGKYLLRISLTVCCMLMSSRLEELIIIHNNRRALPPSQPAESSHRCLFMGAAELCLFFLFSYFSSCVFNGFLRWNEYKMDFSNLNSPLNKYFLHICRTVGGCLVFMNQFYHKIFYYTEMHVYIYIANG